MLFNSWEFWAFFAVVLPLYWLLPRISFKNRGRNLPIATSAPGANVAEASPSKTPGVAVRAQNRFLLVASYVFYGAWNWRFLPLILFSTAMDFLLGRAVATATGARRRKLLIGASVILNLTLLAVFKYYDFFAGQLASIFGVLRIPISLPLLHLLLPVGISFYTFQSMSYVWDIYRGISKPAESFWDFALYVSFFPHLVAGPIMRSGLRKSETGGAPGLLKQIVNPRQRRAGDFREGLQYILLGLFKKVVIGDNLAVLVNAIFQTSPSKLNGLECLAGVYAFAFQIYADFSGYSSIAQGIAKWMGFDLMLNFRMPYLAVSPSDFWRRWHISLSTWLRDYVYISFGGNRGSNWTTYRNLMLTMILGGIWHGANWTFVAWGVYHGILLCVYRVAAGSKKERTIAEYSPAGAFVRAVVMFHLVALGWLLFRAGTITQALQMFTAICTNLRATPLAISTLALVVFYAGPLMIYELAQEYRGAWSEVLQWAWAPRALAYSYCALMLVFFPAEAAHEFIYFQF